MLTKLLVFFALFCGVVRGEECWWHHGPRVYMNADSVLGKCESNNKSCWIISNKDYVRAGCEDIDPFCHAKSHQEHNEFLFRTSAIVEKVSDKIMRSECCTGHMCNDIYSLSSTSSPSSTSSSSSLSSLLPLTLSLLSFIGYSMQ